MKQSGAGPPIPIEMTPDSNMPRTRLDIHPSEPFSPQISRFPPTFVMMRPRKLCYLIPTYMHTEC